MFGSSGITVQVNRRTAEALGARMSNFQEYKKQLMADLAKEEAALTCREALNFSPPLDGAAGGKGDKKIAQTWGNYAVANDILAIVQLDSKKLAAAVNSTRSDRAKFDKWRQGKPPSAAGIIQKIWADTNGDRAFERAKSLLRNWNGSRDYQTVNAAQLETRHNRLRKLYKGRLRKNGILTKDGKVKGEAGYTFASESDIKAYIKKRQLRVGWLKAGWLDCISKLPQPIVNGVPKQFGIRRIPEWISRHKTTNGQVEMTAQNPASGQQTLVVRNLVGNIFGRGYAAGTKNYVLAARRGKSQKRLNHIMRAALKKFNSGQTPS